MDAMERKELQDANVGIEMGQEEDGACWWIACKVLVPGLVGDVGDGWMTVHLEVGGVVLGAWW